jgi:hypothetical protein
VIDKQPALDPHATEPETYFRMLCETLGVALIATDCLFTVIFYMFKV